MLSIQPSEDSICYSANVDGYDIFGYGSSESVPEGAVIMTAEEYVVHMDTFILQGQAVTLQILSDSMNQQRSAYDARIEVLVDSGMTPEVAAAIIGARP